MESTWSSSRAKVGGLPPFGKVKDVLKDRAGSYIITGTTKEGGLHHGE